MSKIVVTAAALATLAIGYAAPAVGQEQPLRIREIEVFGNDPCPRSTDDEIFVCARKPDSERFRIPERLRAGGSLQTRQAWANQAKNIEIHSRTGINSCSPVGPAGFTGCTEQLINQAFREREEQVEGDTAP